MPEVMHCLRLDIHLQELPDTIEHRLLQHIQGIVLTPLACWGHRSNYIGVGVGIGFIFRVDARRLHML